MMMMGETGRRGSMWCRNVAAGLASLRRPARARAATSIPPRSPMASKRPRKGPETKTMQNSPCRDHATTLRRPCNTLQSPLQKPCSTPGGGGGGPEKKRPPGNPEKTLKKKKRPPPPAGGQSAGPQQTARQQEACKLHLAVIDQEPLRSGRPSLRTPLSPPCFKFSSRLGPRHICFFSFESPHLLVPIAGGLMAGHADACQRDALASPSEGCGRQRATACTSSRRHRRRFRRRGRRRRRSPSILSSHPIII